MENNTQNSLIVIVVSLFLTYSLPKIIDMFMKRFGEPKISIDTANIQNTLMLYDKLLQRHEALEQKYGELEARYEKLKDEFEELERENEKLKELKPYVK